MPCPPALHAARASPEAAQSAHVTLFAHPACPSLALDPTHLSAFVRLLAQDLDDILSSALRGRSNGWGNPSLGLGWGSHSFELMARML